MISGEKIKASLAVALFVIISLGSVYLASHRQTVRENRETFVKSEKAVWEWRGATSVARADLLALSKSGFTTVYLGTGKLVDLAESKESTTEYYSNLESYILEARTLGINVQAVFGGPKWAEPDYSYLPNYCLKLVLAYNKAHPSAQFTGIQYDIEVYNLSDFATRKSGIMQAYFVLLTDIVARMNDVSDARELELGVLVPYWFDTDTDKVARIMSECSKSYVVIMAYRNEADGGDGSIAKLEGEMDRLVSSQNQAPKVLIALEVADVQPAKITFFGLGLDKLSEASVKIIEAYGDNPHFAGLAIDHAEGLLEMEK